LAGGDVEVFEVVLCGWVVRVVGVDRWGRGMGRLTDTLKNM